MQQYRLPLILFIIFVCLPLLVYVVRRQTAPQPQATTSVVSGIKYVALGDSYTIGQSVTPKDRWPNQLVLKLAEQNIEVNLVANPSVTGYTTRDLLRTEIDEVTKLNPEFITIQIGVNDYFQGGTATEFKKDFAQVLSRVKAAAPNAKILVVNIPHYGLTPGGRQSGNPESIGKGVQEFNKIIAEVSSFSNIPVADIYELSLAVKDDPSLIAEDGLHPSGKQYRLWLTTIAPAAQKLLK
jgi:acyl-CoA thioesterase I